MDLTASQVEGLAPDAASVRAGRKLAKPAVWSETGHHDRMAWGRCKGSAVYDVTFDRGDRGYKCSCPSRKFPCKHVLGLLFLSADSAEALPETAEAPDWAAEWLAKRAERAAKKAEPKESKPVDEKARAKRVAARESKVAGGLARLDVWLQDLVRGGLAGLEAKGPDFWNEPAKRLVDAQAGTLASTVEALATIPGSQPGWPAEMLSELGRVKWLVEAYGRAESLPPDLAASMRLMIGFPVTAGEMQPPVEDRWCLLGQTTDETARVRTQTTWLRGRETGRTGYVLQFAAGPRNFEQLLVPGTEATAAVSFFPGRSRRVKLGELSESAPITGRPPGEPDLAAMLDRAADEFAEEPWRTEVLCCVRDVRLVPPSGEGWHVVDTAGAALRLAGAGHWGVLAVTGGHPADIAASYDGRRLRLLGVFAGGRYRGAV